MRSRRLLAALTLFALVLAGCAKAKPEEEGVEKAASVIPIPGTDRVRVRLTPDAVKRLDVHTGTVHDELVPSRSTAPVPAAAAAAPAAAAPAPGETDAAAAKGNKPAPVVVAPPRPAAPTTAVRTVIPFGAVLYAASGEAFTYVNVEPEVYERALLTVDYVTGDWAVLSGGPPAGAVVVTVGGPELSGAEFGVGE